MHGEYFLLRRARRSFLHPDSLRKQYGKRVWFEGQDRGLVYRIFYELTFWALLLTYCVILVICWTIFLGLLAVFAFLLLWVMIAIL